MLNGKSTISRYIILSGLLTNLKTTTNFGLGVKNDKLNYVFPWQFVFRYYMKQIFNKISIWPCFDYAKRWKEKKICREVSPWRSIYKFFRHHWKYEKVKNTGFMHLMHALSWKPFINSICNMRLRIISQSIQTDIDDCSPNPCQNGGKCTDEAYSYKCACKQGYSGTNCETSKTFFVTFVNRTFNSYI